jgi:hypothetical protein
VASAGLVRGYVGFYESSINSGCVRCLLGLGWLDSYLLYASATLVIMGVVAVVLALVFRLRFRRLVAVSGKSAVSVYNKTFMVFDPYGQAGTIFHRFLSLLPFVPMVLGFGMAVLLLVIIDSGLLLTLLVVVFGSSLIVVEESVEAYADSKLLVKAVEGGSQLAVGDVRLLSLMKRLLPRLTRYYLAVAVLFFAGAVVLPFVWVQFLWYFAVVFGGLIQAASGGFVNVFLVVGLYAAGVAVVLFLVTLAKNRLFGHSHLEPMPV